MTLKHRIENLECKVKPSKERFYLIVSKYGETRAEAKQRYCIEKGISIDELESPGTRVGIVRFVKPGDSLISIENNE